MKERVAGVVDPRAGGLDDPRDLHVAEAVDGRDRGRAKRADLHRLPDRDGLLADAELGQALLGALLGGDLEELALVGRRAQEHAVGAQRAGDRRGVGVVLVQVGDERERRGSRGVTSAAARCAARP